MPLLEDGLLLNKSQSTRYRMPPYPLLVREALEGSKMTQANAIIHHYHSPPLHDLF